MRRFKLTGNDLKILAYIGAGNSNMAPLADKLGISRSAISQRMKYLLVRKYVQLESRDNLNHYLLLEAGVKAISVGQSDTSLIPLTPLISANAQASLSPAPIPSAPMDIADDAGEQRNNQSKQEALPSNASQAVTPPSQATSQTIRLHKLEIAFRLLNPLQPNEPPQVALRHGFLSQEVRMQHHTDAVLRGFTLKARLYPSTLVIYAPEIEAPQGTQMGELIGKALDAVEQVAWDIEARLPEAKTKKLDRNTLIGQISDQHLSLTNNVLARWLRLNRFKLVIPDPQGGQPLIEFDFSHDIDEMETHNTSGRGSDALQIQDDFLQAQTKGEITVETWRAMAETVQALVIAEQGNARQVKAILDTEEVFAKNQAEHVRLIKRLNWLLPACIIAIIVIAFLAVSLR